MEKKYIKIIKHLYKNLQKKDELKNEFKKVLNSILLYSFGILFTIHFVFFSFIFGAGIAEFFLSLILGASAVYAFFKPIIFICQTNIFNNIVSKKLIKYNLFNLYCRSFNFSYFLFTIIEEIIKNNEKEHLKFYTKEITHIINSIPEGAIKNNIKMKFIEKMEIDVDSKLIHLNTDKSEESNNIKINCQSISINH